LKNLLDIFIITYNRKNHLTNTLNEIISLSDYGIKIFVLDNNSNDGTHLVFKKSRFSNVIYLKNSINIGANANILRCFEYSSANYIWILGDDDQYNLESFPDLIFQLKSNKYKFIHLGAHEGDWRFGGSSLTPKELLHLGYNYFKFSSFIGNNIYERKLFVDHYLLKGYDNIGNSYPHMPFVIGMYYLDAQIYITSKRIVTAIVGNQSYNQSNWFIWWLNSSRLMYRKQDVLLFFFDHFPNLSNVGRVKLFLKYLNKFNRNIIYNYLRNHLSNKSKIMYIFLFFALKLKRLLLFNLGRN
jgi:glycosyltransferase involved in cell wall biosynthesis